SWWRGVRRFGEETGGSMGREDVAGLLFLNVPQSDVQLLLGRPVDWHPRPNRALLHDRHADRTVTVVPFLQPEADEVFPGSRSRRRWSRPRRTRRRPVRGRSTWPP